VKNELGWYKQELSIVRAQNSELTAALQDLRAKVDASKSRIQELWNMNCSQLVAFDSTLSAKDAEIVRLSSRIAELENKERSGSPESSQEWNLIKTEEKCAFVRAVEVLRSLIDPANKSAAQDSTQQESESVSDFIRRLERMFRVAYYCQVQEGLRYELMKAPAVSGSSQYLELCTAAKNEENRLADLKKRPQKWTMWTYRA
jgi:hypothetical protein